MAKIEEITDSSETNSESAKSTSTKSGKGHETNNNNSGSSMSEAEKLRQKRREKILASGQDRLAKLTNVYQQQDSTSSELSSNASSSTSNASTSTNTRASKSIGITKNNSSNVVVAAASSEAASDPIEEKEKTVYANLEDNPMTPFLKPPLHPIFFCMAPMLFYQTQFYIFFALCFANLMISILPMVMLAGLSSLSNRQVLILFLRSSVLEPFAFWLISVLFVSYVFGGSATNHPGFLLIQEIEKYSLQNADPSFTPTPTPVPLNIHDVPDL